MINLLRADFYRLFRSKSLYVCIAVIAALSIWGVAFMKYSVGMLERYINDPEFADSAFGAGFEAGFDTQLIYDRLMGGEGLTLDSIDISEFFEETDIFLFGGMSVGTGETVAIFSAIFVSLFVTSEFSQSTIQNAVSKGYSRVKIYLSRLIACCTAGLIFLAAAYLFAMAAGGILIGVNTGIVGAGAVARTLTATAAIYIAVCSVVTMVGFTVRSGAGSVAITLLLFLLVNTAFQTAMIAFGERIAVYDYWILTPLYRLSGFEADTGEFLRALLLSAGYTAATTAIGCIGFSKSDIV